MFEKYVLPAIGIAAFVIGGLVAREKAVEITGIVRKSFETDTPSPS